ncbi:hypothetical protein GXW82_43395 [Streptacidiphilus sp. 4-A2]|nr:hypothetical protein [Streptacidiphilus sp. 4-A2]
MNLTDGYPPITRYRLNKIVTETGEIINVDYSSAACASGTPSDPSRNTSLCYPDYWTPAEQTTPIEDWFNKYIVTAVSEQDPTGAGQRHHHHHLHPCRLTRLALRRQPAHPGLAADLGPVARLPDHAGLHRQRPDRSPSPRTPTSGA